MKNGNCGKKGAIPHSTSTACRIVSIHRKVEEFGFWIELFRSQSLLTYKDYNHDFSNFNDDNKTVPIVIKRQ